MTATARLPKPVAETYFWRLHAACRDISTSVLFHPENERGKAWLIRKERAKKICRRCPVMLACREHALTAHEPCGVWGGLASKSDKPCFPVISVPAEVSSTGIGGHFDRRHPASKEGLSMPQRDTGQIRLHSTTFVDQEMLPRYCSPEGDNVPPELEWEDVPDDTAELAVVCEDPDAPTGTFLHWLVTGIDPSAHRIGEGELPPGAVEARNGFGEIGWGGPMPPTGDRAHRYFFHVYAANRPLNLGWDSTVDDLRRALRGAELAHGSIVGLYQR